MPFEKRGFIITADGIEIIKDSLEILDYSIDWTKRLARFSGVIDTSTWTIPSGITQASPNPFFVGDITTIFLSEGSLGSEYLIVNKIVTETPQAREMVMSFTIRIVIA